MIGTKISCLRLKLKSSRLIFHCPRKILQGQWSQGFSPIHVLVARQEWMHGKRANPPYKP